MKNNIVKFLVLIVSAISIPTALVAQITQDPHGFGDKVFLIQSALEAGKTSNGLWDIPGHVGKTDGNLKGTNWLQMQLWQREPGDPDDRVFRFKPAPANIGESYIIQIGRTSIWGASPAIPTKSVEARTFPGHFHVRHLGNGRFKILTPGGLVVAPATASTKNGTKLALLPDMKGDQSEWVFYELATNQMFIPGSARGGSSSGYQGKLDDAIRTKTPGTQYFEQADGAKFASENTGGKVQAYLNNFDKTVDQWSAALTLINAIKTNRDVAARRGMYKAISEANFRKGSGFTENLLKGQIVKQVKDAAAAEKDSEAKEHLNRISTKFN